MKTTRMGPFYGGSVLIKYAPVLSTKGVTSYGLFPAGNRLGVRDKKVFYRPEGLFIPPRLSGFETVF